MKAHNRKQSLIWGGLLILFGVMGLIASFVTITAWAWVAILVVAGVGGYAGFLRERERWSLLIPSYVMWAIAALVALIELNVLQDEWVAAFVLTAIALPFLVTYGRDRAQWWALIPTYVLLVVGLMVVLLEGILSDLLVPAYVMFAIAVPFFVVFFRDREKWWPLIPGGITAVIGIAFLIAESAVEFLVPAMLIVAGVWILLRQIRQKEPGELALESDKLPPE